MFNIKLEVLAFLVVCNLENTEAQGSSEPNRSSWGDWAQAQFCPKGSYAVGFDMKIEPDQGSGDDSALNAILILCSLGGSVTSRTAPWGNWVGRTMCPGSEVLVAFSLQVEENQGFGDDSAANYVKFKCRSFDGSGQTSELVKPLGSGMMGGYGLYSQSCPAGSAICGIKTRVEENQYNGDDTALKNVKLYCCT